ncbi:FAD/NAD(P)-binding domain-containing protein [Irpex rosettiformis]|uniref:FAD/NAD(P)-binding domain-containing protein n=1 Tax=Irpex rosettiformis TaxID=378272 RepID=A0ACB8U8X3_9APHY|nr:FAD/NAD(P)-binding domain-containing protein [Irpex rosettiformis]
MSTLDKKLRIAIVGGGIGGLSFAVALSKSGADFDVDIYESAQCFSEIGAGIGMWPRVSRTLQSLGLEEDLKKAGSTTWDDTLFTYYKSDEVPAVSFGAADSSIRAYHRADFLKVLETHISEQYKTHFGKRIATYEDDPTSPIVIHFTDGTTATCDVLVGTDGVKSAVRKTLFTHLADQEGDSSKAEMLRKCVVPTWCGLVMYRALIPTEDLKAAYPDHFVISSPRYFFGKHQSALTYPIQEGRKVNFAALVFSSGCRDTVYDGPWVSQVHQGELTGLYEHWDPRLTTLLKSIDSPLKWVVNEVRNLPTFVSGRVAILGDAAHSMMPTLASGAGQAIEDAVILADVLSHAQTHHIAIERALKVYDEIRRPFSQQVQQWSFEAGQSIWLEGSQMQKYSAEDSSMGRIPHDELETVLRVDTFGKYHWVWQTTLTPDRELAIEKLRVVT